MLLGSNLTECELCEALKASVFHAHSKLVDLSSNRVNSFEHLLVFESLDEVFKDPDIAEDEAMCLGCDVFDLRRFLALFEQLTVRVVDELAEA